MAWASERRNLRIAIGDRRLANARARTVLREYAMGDFQQEIDNFSTTSLTTLSPLENGGKCRRMIGN
jgi:hypothetical protein